MKARDRVSAYLRSISGQLLTMTYLRKLLPLLLLGGLILAYWPPQLAAQDANQAALVVRFGDGNVQTRCVSFDEPQISGYDLLLRSGLDVTADVQGAGALVCAIDGAGCPASNCLCQCQGGGDCIYWSYWLQNGGQWQYSQGGASMVQVQPGAVQGWSWGPGAVNEAIAPPPTAFEDVCQAPVTATSAPTNTPSPTATLLPTNTAVPPSVTPTATAVPASPTATTVSATVTPLPSQTASATAQPVAPQSPTGADSIVAPATATEAVASLTPTATATVSPTALSATAVPTIIRITVPPLPTGTATAVAIAALPPTAPPTAFATGDNVAETAVSWSAYAVFGAIILGLSLFILQIGRRNNQP